MLDDMITLQKCECYADFNVYVNNTIRNLYNFVAAIVLRFNLVPKYILTQFCPFSVLVQSSCTKPELDAEGAEMECMQGSSHPKWSKQQSNDIDTEKQESREILNKKVQTLDYEAEGTFF